MDKVLCFHRFGNTKFQFNDPDTGAKISIQLSKGNPCRIDRRVAEEYPDIFVIKGGQDAEEGQDAEKGQDELDPVDTGDDSEKDAPVANDADITDDLVDSPPSDEEKPEVPAQDDKNPEGDLPPDPDESENAEQDLKAQIGNFVDKSELDEYAKTLGVNLDGRKSLKKMKKILIAELKI